MGSEKFGSVFSEKMCKSIGGSFNGKVCCIEYRNGKCTYKVPNPPSLAVSVWEFADRYRPYFIAAHVIYVSVLLVLFIETGYWQYINWIFYGSGVFFVLYLGKLNRKTLIILIASVIVYFSVTYFYEYVIAKSTEYDQFRDLFSHFMSGVLVFSVFYIIFPKKGLPVIFLYSVLFAIFYEMIEHLFFQYVKHYIDVWDLTWSESNMMQDFAMDMFGSLSAMLIEYYWKRKKSQYITEKRPRNQSYFSKGG